MPNCVTLTSGSFAVTFDPEIGALRALKVAGQDILHKAHWVGTEAAKQSAAPVDARLSGDFFCAPFGGSGFDDIPPHGFTANSTWEIKERSETPQGATLLAVLTQDVFGAKVTKTLRLIKDHPAIYQTHDIDGGQGDLTFAHHPMVHLSGGGHVGFSPKIAAVTPAGALEPKHKLAYPARSSDLSRFPAENGGTVDLHSYPAEATQGDPLGHEDFVTLIEAPKAQLGWTAVTRFGENDIVIFLKDPKVAPVTMMWHSNGGRDYAPWDGRHTGVLGIEDGCCAGAATVAQSVSDNPISREGCATSLSLGPSKHTQVRHAIVRIPLPKGWRGVAQISAHAQSLELSSLDGAVLSVPFDTDFLGH
jgi:hypothetical protein